jgi:membrane protease subunit HflK
MAWNDSGNGKNPWDRGGQEGPPDLDKIIRDWQKKLSAMLGGGKGGAKGGSGSGGAENGAPLIGVLVLVLLGWGFTGFYQVDEAERGIVQRFGAYVSTAMPGLRWHVPWPIETVDKVNVSFVDTFSQTTSMLTADENIVVVEMEVQYRRTDPIAYLFDVVDPEGTLADSSESVIREVVGKNTMDYVLGDGRVAIAEETRVGIQDAVDEYKSGMIVATVNLSEANFPADVEAAVQDANKSREDRERFKLEAESYANDILPKARGKATRVIQNAEAYRERVIADSEGEAARFIALLEEYEKAPDVTRERLYIDAIEEVYGQSSKVLLDAEGSGNLLYLPIDKLMQQGSDAVARPAGRASGQSSGSSQAPGSSALPVDAGSRSRGAR